MNPILVAKKRRQILHLFIYEQARFSVGTHIHNMDVGASGRQAEVSPLLSPAGLRIQLRS